MKPICFFITVIAFIHATLFAQTSDPGVKVVAKEFYNKYKMPDGSYPIALFEKRGSQYWVVEQIINKNTIVPAKPILFFDGQTYLTLNFPPSVNDTSNYDNYITDYDVRQYQLNKYYGYRGWYKDVIKELEDSASTSDEMYSLARAYSAAANALVSDQLGDAVYEEIFTKSFNVNTFTVDQLRQYRKAMQKSTSAYAALATKYPGYMTIVGTAGVKAANELMVEFHTILTFANYAVGQVQLPDSLYTDSVITKAKAILKACPKNAILTSFGDNDFYPFLYAQYKLKVRPDVYVINDNLLGVDRFIYRFTRPAFTSPGIKLSVDTSYYKGNTNDYFYLTPGKQSISFTEVINTLKEQKETGDLKTLQGESIIVPIRPGKSMPVTLDTTKQYIMKMEWVMLDIIKNLADRKICFQQPAFYDFPAFDKNLKQSGAVYILDVN